MKIYIGRHGLANSTSIDPEASLCEQGKLETSSIAKILCLNTLGIKQIYHSEKKRAKQTAEIIASYLHVTCITNPLLNPSNSVEPLLSSLEDQTLYIGHLPNIEDLISKLILNMLTSLIIFNPSTIACLEKIQNNWLISWVICPNLVRNYDS